MRDSIKICVLLLFFTMLGGALSAQESPATTYRFAGVPAVGFGDTGLGGGLVGTMYLDEVDYEPYKMAFTLKTFFTTKYVNSHALQIDLVKAFGLPLRLVSRVGFFSTPALTFCGLASEASCDVNRANLEATSLSVADADRAQFVDQYYKHRLMSFFGDIHARWLLWENEAKLELMTNYRGRYYLDRDFSETGRYPNSLYAKTFKDQNGDGYLSTLEVGIMLDKRDNEPAPTSGYWVETSVRGGAFFTGSAWNYFGANAAGRFYVPLDEDHKFVFASQTMVDAIVGDLPYEAMSRVGGTQSINDYTGIGGQNLGRGISEQLYVGRLKGIQQAEFRYTFWSFGVLSQDFDLTFAAMGDFAMTAWDYSRLRNDLDTVYVGFGGGLRIHWNKTFIIRADLGVSPYENFSPKFYLAVGNVF